MLRAEQAQAVILDPIAPLRTEDVDLHDALGRVLAEDVIAGRDQPPAANSAMDGYAVRWADLADLVADADPVALTVAEVIAAGGWSERTLQPGEAARIFTGAPLPPGADHIVKQEWATAQDDGESVLINRTGSGPGHHVRGAGEDVASGDVVVPAGRSLTPADLALLASQGAPTVRCIRRPIVAIVSTGDEVHEPGVDLPPGHIYSGNHYALEAYIREAGGVPRYLGIARDTLDSLRSVFGRIEGSDAVVSIGGVSVGDYDLVRKILAEIGGEQHFWKVATRPGKPNACGTLGGIPYFGLPGNPVSCMVSFLQYVRPALRKMQGATDLYLPTVEAVLDHDLESKAGFMFLYRAIVDFDRSDGRYHVGTTGLQGSGMMSSMARANCLIVVPEDSSFVAAGQSVTVQFLPGAVAGQAEPRLRKEA